MRLDQRQKRKHDVVAQADRMSAWTQDCMGIWLSWTEHWDTRLLPDWVGATTKPHFGRYMCAGYHVVDL